MTQEGYSNLVNETRFPAVGNFPSRVTILELDRPNGSAIV